MPKHTALTDALSSLLSQAGKTCHALMEWSGDEIGATLTAEAKKSAAELNTLMQLAENLHDKATAADAFAEARKLFNLGNSPTIEQARERTLKELQHSLATTKKTMAFRRIQGLMGGASVELEEQAQTSGMVRRIGDWASEAYKHHDAWIENASAGKRVAFGAGCVGVGTLCMFAGGEWLTQAFFGQKAKRVKVMGEDGDGTTVTIAKPLSVLERVAKGVVGTGATGLGLIGFNKGFIHLFYGGR